MVRRILYVLTFPIAMVVFFCGMILDIITFPITAILAFILKREICFGYFTQPIELLHDKLLKP